MNERWKKEENEEKELHGRLYSYNGKIENGNGS
jgi:hypothetical protein